MPDFEGKPQPTAEVDSYRLRRELADRESMLWGRVGLKLLIGIPLTLAGPFALAVLLKIMGWVNDWGTNSFFLWLFLACAIWLPIVHHQVKKRSSSSVFADEMIGEVGGDSEYWRDTDSYAQWEARSPGSEVLERVTEILLKGPRELFEAWRIGQERKLLGDETRVRSTEIVQYLASFEKGVPWLELRKGREPILHLLSVLGYLKLTDWIGTSTDGRKVWLLSDVRKRLLRK